MSKITTLLMTFGAVAMLSYQANSTAPPIRKGVFADDAGLDGDVKVSEGGVDSSIIVRRQNAKEKAEIDADGNIAPYAATGHAQAYAAMPGSSTSPIRKHDVSKRVASDGDVKLLDSSSEPAPILLGVRKEENQETDGDRDGELSADNEDEDVRGYHFGRGGKPDRRGLSSKQGPLVKLGISQFLKIQDEWVQLNCEEGRTLADVTASMWVPGCELKTKRQICTAPCYDVRLLEDAVNFNKENPGDVVHYPSRRGIGHDGVPIESITLGGWWLPAPPRFGSSTPRIVLQHGFTAHSNDHTVLGVSYMLRSIGYSVLINNFRDHCYSENSTARSSEWGHAYPYDLLGAWDYAQTDPDGILGGTYPASKVGVLGFSMGGFAAVNAFGLEQAIPAIWVDAPAFTPKASFENFFPSLRPGIILDKVIDHVWKGIESESLSRGIDLNENLPSVVLEEVAATQAPRPVYVVNNKDDKKVLPSEIELLVELLNKYPTKFELSRYEVEGRCHGNNHCDMHWSHHEQYLDRLCNFWTSVFSQDQSYCGL